MGHRGGRRPGRRIRRRPAILRFLANFTFWARDLLNYFQSLWDSLWGSRPPAGPEVEATGTGRAVSYRPFNSFGDPFLTGRAEIMSPQELVRYSFDALQAWARERGMPRRDDETPLEFAQRVAEVAPALGPDALQLGNYYAAAAYAPWSLKDSCRDSLRQFWLSLAEAAAPPRSQKRTRSQAEPAPDHRHRQRSRDVDGRETTYSSLADTSTPT